jgi:hypothetical protein
LAHVTAKSVPFHRHRLLIPAMAATLADGDADPGDDRTAIHCLIVRCFRAAVIAALIADTMDAAPRCVPRRKTQGDGG